MEKETGVRRDFTEEERLITERLMKRTETIALNGSRLSVDRGQSHLMSPNALRLNLCSSSYGTSLSRHQALPNSPRCIGNHTFGEMSRVPSLHPLSPSPTHSVIHPSPLPPPTSTLACPPPCLTVSPPSDSSSHSSPPLSTPPSPTHTFHAPSMLHPLHCSFPVSSPVSTASFCSSPTTSLKFSPSSSSSKFHCSTGNSIFAFPSHISPVSSSASTSQDGTVVFVLWL